MTEGKDGLLRARPYPVDLNGTAEENTEATGSVMRRRNFGGVGGVRVEGGRVCGVGEQVIREAMVVESAKLIRMRMWRGGVGGGFGRCCGVMRGSSFGRPAVVRWRRMGERGNRKARL
jgi:hypothetical protein